MPDIQSNPKSNITDTRHTPTNQNVVENNSALDKASIKIRYPAFFWNQTQELIKNIESKVNTKVLVYYMNPDSSIVNDDVEYFYSHIKDLSSDLPITLILVSNGGSGMAAWRIANLLKQFCNHLTVVVASRCASAATLLCLSADKILFGPSGYLTAIDTSLNHVLNPKSSKGDNANVSVDQINRIKTIINNDLKNHPSTKTASEILFEYIHPIVIGELERTSNLSKMIAKNLIELRNDQLTEEVKDKIIDTLNDSYPAHGYPIVLKEAKQIGLPAESLSKDANQIVWELIKSYSLITKKATTDFTSNFYHVEVIPVIIESVGKRTFYSNSFSKQFEPAVDWSIKDDKTSWLSATPNPESPEKPKISQIEL